MALINDLELSLLPPNVRRQYEESLVQSGETQPEENQDEGQPRQDEGTQETPKEGRETLLAEKPQDAPPEKPAEQVAPPTGSETVEKPAASENQDERIGKLESALRVLQGKYNAEVPRLHEELKGKDWVIAQLTDQLARAPEQKPPTEPAKPISDDEETVNMLAEKFNMESDDARLLLQVIDTRASRLADEQAKAAAKPIEDRLRSREQEQDQIAAEAYDRAILAEIPDAFDRVPTPEFQQKLEEKIPGGTSLLMRHHNDRNAPAVIKLIKFVDESPSPVPVTQASGGAPKPATSLAAQATPRPSSPKPPEPAKKTYTWAQYDEAYTDITKNYQKYLADGTYDKKLAELESAWAEGRVK